jgi:hypothetical protein
MTPEVVLAARWCHRRNLMSPIDSAASVFYWLSAEVFRLACTVKKLFVIFGCDFKFGCKFAFETNFCKFDPCNNPDLQFLLSHIVYLAEMRNLSNQAPWYVYPVPRYARKRLSWESPLTSPKWGAFGGLFPHGMRRIDQTPKRCIFGRNRVDWCITFGLECSGSAVRLPNKSPEKKTPRTVCFTYMGSRDPLADHYELWLT